MPVAGRAVTEGLIQGDARDFAEHFNQGSFSFAHHLAGNPLFELARLIQLAKSAPLGDVYYDAGDIRIDQRWRDTPPCDLPVDETIRRIRDAQAWIILKRAEKDREYGAVLEACLEEIQGLLGADMRRNMKVREAIIFITSPHRLTPYHIDRECNFLLQLSGEKKISVFDRNDREVLTEEELERFWAVDNNSAVYKEQYQDRAVVYTMRPGEGVHIPVNAPHWVRNGNEVSVSLSVNFQFHDSMRANVYRMNYFVRKLGITPAPPGRFPWRDSVKRCAMGSAIGARNVLRRVGPR